MAGWHVVLDAEALPPGTGRAVEVAGRHVAVFNVGGEYHAIDDTCPHQGASLGEGFLHNGEVVCPWHNWSFDVRSGACPRVPHIAVESYPTRCADGRVEVQLPADEPPDPKPE